MHKEENMELEGMLAAHFGTSHKPHLGSPSQATQVRRSVPGEPGKLLRYSSWPVPLPGWILSNPALTQNGESESQVEDPKCSSFSFFPW